MTGFITGIGRGKSSQLRQPACTLNDFGLIHIDIPSRIHITGYIRRGEKDGGQVVAVLAGKARVAEELFTRMGILVTQRSFLEHFQVVGQRVILTEQVGVIHQSHPHL